MRTRRYTVLLKPALRQGGYWVDVPALPGVYSYGDTVAEAMTSVRAAIAGFIEALEKDGEPIPEETTPYEVRQVEVAA